MGNKKQVVEKIENKKDVLNKKKERERLKKQEEAKHEIVEAKIEENKENQKEKDNLNYKVSSTKPEFSSKKVKTILIVCFALFIALACLSSIKGCTPKEDDYNYNTTKSTDGISSGVNRVYDSVVYITSYNDNTKSTSGTGFAYKKSRGSIYILTNYHVIANSSTIKIVLSNGKSTTGDFAGGDKYLDIAVIKISSKNSVKLAKFGSSYKTPLGANLFTIGIPVGDEYKGTVTKGILSGKNRLVNVSVNGVREDYITEVLQTDAAMSPGNSGGPLCNSKGYVIGVNSMKFVKSDVEGMAFAIPIESIKEHLTTFESGKNITRPYLGINMLNMSEKSSLKKYNLNTLANDPSNSGIAVVSVKGNTSSYGKLKRGDVITKINGTSVSDIAHLRYELFKHKVGDKISLTLDRDGSIKTTKIVLGSEK